MPEEKGKPEGESQPAKKAEPEKKEAAAVEEAVQAAVEETIEQDKAVKEIKKKLVEYRAAAESHTQQAQLFRGAVAGLEEVLKTLKPAVEKDEQK